MIKSSVDLVVLVFFFGSNCCCVEKFIKAHRMKWPSWKRFATQFLEIPKMQKRHWTLKEHRNLYYKQNSYTFQMEPYPIYVTAVHDNKNQINKHTLNTQLNSLISFSQQHKQSVLLTFSMNRRSHLSNGQKKKTPLIVVVHHRINIHLNCT